MSAIVPFRIAVPDGDLTDLRERLHRTRWPERECVADWSQGIPLDYTRELAAYWADEYDWRAREQQLNRFDHFTTEIDGPTSISSTSARPTRTRFPLIITHGWPGSVVEFHKVIEPLTDPTAHGGRAGTPSMSCARRCPGYGFSGKPAATGWGIEKVAQAWETLMTRLGYHRYGAQGGDWGAAITTAIGVNGGHCAAIHLNMPLGLPAADRQPDRRGAGGLDTHRVLQAVGFRLFKQQSTRPQTLGYGLTDSPAGQLAWIVEKFWSWTDCDGHPENVLSRDEMLDNVMLYWLTASAASSARLYWESFGRISPTCALNYPPAQRLSPRSSSVRRGTGVSRGTTSRTGPTCRVAVTLRHSSNPSCSSTTCGCSSLASADSVQIHARRTITAPQERVFEWLADPAKLTAGPLVRSCGVVGH